MPFDMTHSNMNALDYARELRSLGQPWSAVTCGIHFKCSSRDERDAIVRLVALEECIA